MASRRIKSRGSTRFVNFCIHGSPLFLFFFSSRIRERIHPFARPSHAGNQSWRRIESTAVKAAGNLTLVAEDFISGYTPLLEYRIEIPHFIAAEISELRVGQTLRNSADAIFVRYGTKGSLAARNAGRLSVLLRIPCILSHGVCSTHGGAIRGKMRSREFAPHRYEHTSECHGKIDREHNRHIAIFQMHRG